MHEIHFWIRGMEWPAVHSARTRPANYNRRRRVPKIMPLGHEIRQLVEAASNEIYKLHLGDRPKSEITHAASRAYDGALTDGRVDDPLPAKTLEQPLTGFERPAIYAYIFAEQNDRRVSLHLFKHGLLDSFQKGDRRGARRLRCSVYFLLVRCHCLGTGHGYLLFPVGTGAGFLATRVAPTSA